LAPELRATVRTTCRFAAFDQSVPYDVRDMRSVRYGQKVNLTFGIDDFNQILIAEPAGLGENRSSDFDGVI
jgi:hypothetical protein